ncbi:MAG TPA: hypothetical protein VGX95_12025 [Xanthobacteraceae bacterium]|jgi:hypothetical protein|nr:hypothetical protein [Xanthobacteraceae bacterium]
MHRHLAVHVTHLAALRAGATLTVAAATGLSLWYAVNSFRLGLALIEPLPYFDQWTFIENDYFRYLDGLYRWTDLFARHYEHRILTTRLVLFADAMFFQMRGVMPILFIYATLALTGAGIAALCADTARRAAIVFLAGLGLAWSTSQWPNLASAFQVEMSLVHLFALAALAAASVGSTAALCVAAAADALAVFTLGSGIFLIFPLGLVAALNRRYRGFVPLALFHLALAVVYLNAAWPPTDPVYGFDPLRSLMMMLEFIGLPFAGAASAGAVGLLVFGCLLGLAIRRSANGIRDGRTAALLGLAAFVLIEGAVVAYTRFEYGVGARYGTAAVVFWLATMAAAWRMAGNRFSAAMALVAGSLTLVANQPLYEADWREYFTSMEQARHDLVSGDLSGQSLARVFVEPQAYLPDAIRRLERLHAGPFR